MWDTKQELNAGRANKRYYKKYMKLGLGEDGSVGKGDKRIDTLLR